MAGRAAPGTVVVAYVRAADGKRDELVEVLERSQARSRTEDGCVRYGFSQAVEDPDAFVAVEEWRDREALRVHLQTDNIKELMAALGGLVAEAPEIVSYEVEPRDMPF